MGVTVKQNFSVKTLALTTREDMEAIGRLARERIIRRTVMGQGPNNETFAPYSTGYYTQKSEALGTASPVNLQVSGEMLRAIQVVVDSDKKVSLIFNA
jgi:hypothetical protein